MTEFNRSLSFIVHPRVILGPADGRAQVQVLYSPHGSAGKLALEIPASFGSCLMITRGIVSSPRGPTKWAAARTASDLYIREVA